MKAAADPYQPSHLKILTQNTKIKTQFGLDLSVKGKLRGLGILLLLMGSKYKQFILFKWHYKRVKRDPNRDKTPIFQKMTKLASLLRDSLP